MMHVICILIVLALCGSAWSTALPNKFAHDALDGFHGFLWGTPIDSLRTSFGLTDRFALSPDSSAYSCRSSVIEVAGAEVSNFQLSFFRDRFCGLTFETNSEADFEQVRGILRAKYGHESKTETYGHEFSWNSGASVRTGEYNKISKVGTFALCSWPMIQEAQATFTRFLARPPNPAVQIPLTLAAPDTGIATADSTGPIADTKPGPSLFGHFGLLMGSIILILAILLLIAWILFPVLMFHRLSQIRRILLKQKEGGAA